MGAQDGADVKRMQHGFGASNGLLAALLAQSGYTGISKVFEKPYGGFVAAFNQGSQLGAFTKAQGLVRNLGSDWSALQNICVKPYASMLGTHAPIDCIRNLQSKHPSIVLHLRDIQSIRIIQSEAWYGHGGQDIERPINALAAQMSTKYCVAAQLVDSNVKMPQFLDSRLNRDSIWGLIPKIQCECDPKFTDSQKDRTIVRLKMKDGSTFTEDVHGPTTTTRPLSNEEIRAKWRINADNVLPQRKIRAIENRVGDLEVEEDVRELIDCVSKKTRRLEFE
ncbi:hypothetical protein KC338_g9225 [Hortaea werneckii]|nr:hypothetical protein KC323_g9372 [Hortaea werneckii]KAI6854575.1 hypothetical protein KC338_g9225 [Hortaea werneckii]KAI7059017.1 hypothetical protein KC339_g17471 [Hortaea werneckii]KAI7206991.1 hypothetical protein KC365_g16819 [Hortaea werneckii]